MATYSPVDLHDTAAQNTSSRRIESTIHALSYLPYLDYGTVVYCVPLHRVYYVQPYRGGPIRMCKLLTRGPTGLLGPYDADTIPPLTSVWFINVPDTQYGYIIGCEPTFLTSGSQFYGDAIVRNARVGMDEEGEYRLPYAMGAQIPVFSGRTPVDSVEIGEFCRISETGTMLFLDSFMAALRAGDTCGVTAHLPNRLLRLLGRNFQLWTPVSADERYLSPQGLSVLINGISANAMEGLGIITDPDHYNATQPIDPVKISPAGRPVYRDLTLRGGIVDGEAKFIFGVHDGARHANYGEAVEYPLSVTYRSHTGHIIHASCSGIHLVKTNRMLGVVPIQPVTSRPDTIQPKDAQPRSNILLTGDPEQDADIKPINVLDQHYLLLRRYISQGARAGSTFQSVDSVSGGAPTRFRDIDAAATLARPLPTYHTHTDPANRRVLISENVGYIGILDDGSVCLSDGWGAEIRLSRGCVYITAPLDIYLDAGRNVIHFAGRDAIFKAYKAMDLSTSQGDMRLKAEKNLHLLGANAGGDSGVLIESRSTTSTNYQEGLGTAARYPGVNIVANQSNIILKAENVTSYAATSIIDSAPGGMIVRQGDRLVDRTSCAIVQVFEYDEHNRSYKEIENCDTLEKASASYVGPRYNIFTYQSAVLDGELLAKGDIVAYNDLIVGGHSYIAGDLLIDSQLARNTRTYLRTTGMGISGSIESDPTTSFLKNQLHIYAANLFFTCRVDSDYVNANFVYPEGRWVEEGVHDWKEPPVVVRFVDPTCTNTAGSGKSQQSNEFSTWPFPGERYYDTKTKAQPIITSTPNIDSNDQSGQYRPHVSKYTMDKKARLG